MHDTGAALAGIAADMGAGQVQVIAQEIDKEGTVLDLSRDRLAVHRQFDCRHVETSPCFLIAPIRSTGAGLCNNDFCRDTHCDAVCASTVVPAIAGDPKRQSNWARCEPVVSILGHGRMQSMKLGALFAGAAWRRSSRRPAPMPG